MLRVQRRPSAFNYFLTLMLALNVLMPFGYLFFSGLSGVGDWAAFVEGLGPPYALRAVLALVGALLYFLVAPKIIMPTLNPYLGREPELRASRARLMSLYPYVAGGVVFVIAGLLNPSDWKLVLISAAAASFGGTSLLAWYPGRADASWSISAPGEAANIPRSPAWMVAAAVLSVVFVGVLGPSVRLR
jgi:hypothetical protein